MKLDIFDVEEFIKVNHLEEVTNPVLMEKDGSPHPNGLLSNEIFGITTKSRKETFAYIKLYGHYFHPHVYKAIKRMFKNIDSIISGEKFYSINEEGKLVIDEENGQTGIEFLYDNWENINWSKGSDSSMRNEREFLLESNKKNIIFMEYQIVCPVYYRDIRTKQSGGNVEDDINKMYANLLRLTATIRDQYLFSFQFNNTNMSIQNLIVSIYDYFKDRLSGKTGLIRRFLLGKSCDYCTRTVITAETYGGEDRPSDRPISFEYSSIPIAHALALCYPFVTKYIHDFFQRELIDNQLEKIIYDPVSDTVIGAVELKDPGAYFSDRYIDKMINTFIKDPESRFTKIKVPTKDGSLKYLAFTGQKYDASTNVELSSTMYRPMCWTDLLYMACVDVAQDKHCLITRYPVLNEYGTFITKVNISSTLRTEPVLINDRVYRFYPIIEYDTPIELVGTKFIDSVRFSNSYLTGLDGDLTYIC